MSAIVQRLPHDIFRKIFTYFSTHLRIREWQAFPWFLGHISSEWRYIFISMTPEFWSNISLDWQGFGAGGKLYEARQILAKQLVELFLERSSGRPFSFQYRLPTRYLGPYLTPQWEFACRIFDMFVQESTRWVEVSIKADISAVRTLNLVQNRIPLLQKMELYVTGGLVDSSLVGAFENAPSLTSVVVSEVSTWKFDWSSLTHFRLDFSVKFDDFLSIISQMSRLQHLIVCKDYVGPYSPHRTILSCLKFLATSGTGLLKALEAPVLEELSIFFPDPDQTDPLYFSRSTPDPTFLHSLRHTLLRLNLSGCTRRTLMEIVPYTPNIVHLGLDCLPDLPNSLEYLNCDRGQVEERLVPQLGSLRIFCHLYKTVTEGDVEVLCAFVTSRSKQVEAGGNSKRFQSLQIQYISSVKERYRLIFKKVKALCEELDVRFDGD